MPGVARMAECAAGVYDCAHELHEVCAAYDETYYNQQGNGGLLGTRAPSSVRTRACTL